MPVVFRGDYNSSSNSSTNNNPNNYDVTDPDVLVAAINTPDLQSGTDFYRNPIATGLMSGPVVGFNSGTEELYSRSIPFNQVKTDEPIRVQRVVASNYVEGGYDQFIVVFTVKNISDEIVCGDAFNFDLLRADGTKGGEPNGDPVKAIWHGTWGDYVYKNPVITLTSVYSSCIEPDSSIYITRGIYSSMTHEDLDRVNIRSVTFYEQTNSGEETTTLTLSTSVVLPISYTVGSLPESDSRVSTGASDEFVKVTIVNSGSTVQDINIANMFLMDASGYPLTRTSSTSDGIFSFLEVTPLEPGEEYVLIFKNDIAVGEDVSSIRVMVASRPILPEDL